MPKRTIIVQYNWKLESNCTLVTGLHSISRHRNKLSNLKRLNPKSFVSAPVRNAVQVIVRMKANAV